MGKASIGVYNEKLLHQILKDRYTGEDGAQEVPVGPFTADILKGNEIIEIQTGGFYPLRAKLEYYMKNTGYSVNIVHPVVSRRWLVWVSPETGETVSRRRSPKKEEVRSLLREIFWISEYIGSPRLKITAAELCIEEIRLLDGWSADKKKGSSCHKKIPLEFYGESVLATASDFASLLPAALPEEFTRGEYQALCGVRSLALSSEINALCAIGVIEKAGRRGRNIIYKKQRTETL